MDEYYLTRDPVRPCCGKRHPGVVCPDGYVMCCLCFNRFEVKDLHKNEDGSPENVCQPCAQHEQQALLKLQASLQQNLPGQHY